MLSSGWSSCGHAPFWVVSAPVFGVGVGGMGVEQRTVKPSSRAAPVRGVVDVVDDAVGVLCLLHLCGLLLADNMCPIYWDVSAPPGVRRVSRRGAGGGGQWTNNRTSSTILYARYVAHIYRTGRCTRGRSPNETTDSKNSFPLCPEI